jgi:hypothetical protein
MKGVPDFFLRDPTSNISWLKPVFSCDLPLNQSIKVESGFAELLENEEPLLHRLARKSQRFNSNTLLGLLVLSKKPPQKGVENNRVKLKPPTKTFG